MQHPVLTGYFHFYSRGVQRAFSAFRHLFIYNNTALIILFLPPHPVCHHYVTPTSVETTQILIESCDWWWIIPREASGAMERGAESLEMALCVRIKYSLLQSWRKRRYTLRMWICEKDNGAFSIRFNKKNINLFQSRSVYWLPVQ